MFVFTTPLKLHQTPSNSITKTKFRYDIDTKQVRVYLFRLEEYDKIIYLDTRSLVLKPLHNLFELPDTPLASSIAYWESENRFTESLLIVRPSKALYDEMSSNQQDDDITVLTKYFEHRLPESRNFPDVLMLPGTFVVAESSLDDTKGVFDDMSSATLESEASILRFESDPWISSSSRESKSSRVERFYDMFFEEYSNPLSTNDDPSSTNDDPPSTNDDNKLKVLWIVTHIPGATPERDENVAHMKTLIPNLQVQHGFDENRCVPLLTELQVCVSPEYWYSQGYLLSGKLGHWCSLLDIIRMCESYDYCIAIQDDIPWRSMYNAHFLREINDGAFTKFITRRSRQASEGVLVIRGREHSRSLVSYVQDTGINNPTDIQLRRFHEVKDARMFVKGHLEGRSLIRTSHKITIETYNRRLHESCSEDKVLDSSASTTISIGVPAIFQDMNTLQDLIDSVEKQTVMPDEIVIYMTGVGSSKVSTTFRQITDVPIRIFTETEQKMSGYSRNRVMEQATSEFVMFLDADDLMHPRRVEMVKENLKKGFTLVLNGHQDPPFNQELSSAISTHDDLVRSARRCRTLYFCSLSSRTHKHVHIQA